MTHEDLIVLCHAQAHEAEHDYEDAVLIALTRRECWLILLSTLLLSGQALCLAGNCLEFHERLAEILDSQKPHWRNGYTPPET